MDRKKEDPRQESVGVSAWLPDRQYFSRNKRPQLLRLALFIDFSRWAVLFGAEFPLCQVHLLGQARRVLQLCHLRGIGEDETTL